VPRRTLRLARQAIEDLTAVRRWQSQPGAGAGGAARVRRIRAAIRTLKVHPCLHLKGERPGTRELSCERHRIVYRVDPDTGRDATAGDVLVLRVFGPGQARDP
jgi:plasmid stabilization system protein ParE